MTNTTVNVGPLLVTMSVLFTTYLGAALALPSMPSGVHQALASAGLVCDTTSARDS